MSFGTFEEAEDYYGDRMAEKQHVVDECEVALRSLNAAFDYIEGVMADRESGDLLPSASSFAVNLGERLMMVSDRIVIREEMQATAESSIHSLEEELDMIRDDFADREAEGDGDGDELEDLEDME